MSLKSAKKLPPKSLPSEMRFGSTRVRSRRKCISPSVLRVAVINTARTIVAKNGAGSRIVFPGRRRASTACLCACVRATPRRGCVQTETKWSVRSARAVKRGPEEGRAGGGHGEGEAL